LLDSPRLRLRLKVGGDEALVDAVERPLAEERRDVAGHVAAVVLDRRALALHDVFEVVDVFRTGLGDRPLLPARHDDGVGIHAPSQFALGLHAGQAVPATGLALVADPAVGLAAAGRLPAPVPALAPARRLSEERPRPMRAPPA
jgi:hypothetical protein